jgi:dTDP-glucose 4,6-dehydratase
VIDRDLEDIIAACTGELRQLVGKTLLVTGASGFIARYLVESVLRFSEAGLGGQACSVTLVGRDLRMLESRYAREIEEGSVSLIGWKDATSARKRRHWDYVVHAAAPSDPQLIQRNPERSLKETSQIASIIADIAKESQSLRAVLISSGAVYGVQPTSFAEISEDEWRPDRDTPTSTYGKGKRKAELLFGAAGIDQRVVRVFSVLGPYQPLTSNLAAPDFIRQAATSGTIQLKSDGSAVRNYCYAADLASFLIKLLMGEPKHVTYNVGNRNSTVSINTLAVMVSAVFGGVTIARAHRPSEPSDVPQMYVPRLDRMYEMYSPTVGIDESLSRTCQSWFNRGLIGRGPEANVRAH